MLCTRSRTANFHDQRATGAEREISAEVDDGRAVARRKHTLHLHFAETGVRPSPTDVAGEYGEIFFRGVYFGTVVRYIAVKSQFVSRRVIANRIAAACLKAKYHVLVHIGCMLVRIDDNLDRGRKADFGEIGLLTGGERIADVIALGPIKLLNLSRSTYEEFLLERADFQQKVALTAAKRAAENLQKTRPPGKRDSRRTSGGQ